jgi:hypothetical protein
MPRDIVIAALVLAHLAFAAERGVSKTEDDDVVFRSPFTIRLPIDRTHYFEEKKGRLPHVSHGEVGLFFGDRFGLKIDVQNGTVRSVKYERDLSKADVTLEFKQGDPIDGKATSLLIMQNRTKYTFLMDAAMEVPNRKDFVPTSIHPLGAGLSGIESWPHPIVGLGLRNIRVKK